MIPEHTPAVARALAAAGPHPEPLRLLAVLLAEPDGRPAMLIRRAGGDPDALIAACGLALAGGGERPSPPAITDLLIQARRLSADRIVASEHLLAVLIQADEVRNILTAAGIDPGRLHERNPSPSIALDEPLRLVEPTETIDTARILDAAANRAREGLRVVEDYCRFVLDDAFLTGELKHFRHDLTAALATLPGGLEARETQRDVGTAISTEQEQSRHSLVEVAQVNLKRVQESLRSLEEFAKLQRPALGEALEQLRYRSYTLERAIVLGTQARERLADARLYVLLTRDACQAALDWTIQEAAAGGARIIQLREKGLTDAELLARACQVRHWTRQAGVLFIINDRPDIARLAEADGVHLGQEDMPVKEARRILGPDGLIGVSTHDLDQVRQAILDGASYLGVGPTFPSATKQFGAFPGIDFVRQAMAETTLPAFVIGGVTLQTLDAAIAAGARRVAVSQAIAQAVDPRATAAAIQQKLGPDS